MSKNKKPLVDDSKFVGDWEYFSDPCDYDLWKVRRKGNRKFGSGITVVNKKSAEELAILLDSGDAMADAIHIMADAIHIKAENINRGLNRWNELTENKNVTVKKG